MASKYNLGDSVWFLSDGGIENRIITGIVSQMDGKLVCSYPTNPPTRVLKELSDKEIHKYNFEYSKCTFKASQTGILESKIYATKEELIASL